MQKERCTGSSYIHNISHFDMLWFVYVYVYMNYLSFIFQINTDLMILFYVSVNQLLLNWDGKR